MISTFRKIFLYTVAGCFLAAATAPVFGQLSLSSLAKTRDKGPKKPTTVTSDSMDIDFRNNKAIFIGNVYVDDDSMSINCHRMEIYLEDKAAAAKKTDENDEEAGFGGGKDLKKIICLGNVVIVRKLFDQADIAAGEQKATAGRAEYDVKADMIVLTEDNPTIQRGSGNKLSGSKITLWLSTERLKVESDPGLGKERAVINLESLQGKK
jgi:lipopolysaccharide transport protein LptA